MPDMKDVIVVPSDLDVQKSDIGRFTHCKEHFSQVRQNLMEHLSSVVSTGRELACATDDDIYQLILSAEDLKDLSSGAKSLCKKGDLFRGQFMKNGKLAEHICVEKIDGNLVTNTAQTLASQSVLANITVKLQEIHQSVKSVEMSLHDDRIARIESGINALNTAKLVKNKYTREIDLANAAQTLREGLEPALTALRRQIQKLPSEKDHSLISQIFSIKSPAEKTKSELPLAGRYLKQLMRGLSALAETYLMRAEPDAARAQVMGYLEKLYRLDIPNVVRIARYVPIEAGNDAPEKLWKELSESKEEIIGGFKQLLALQEKRKPISIEFRVSDLRKKGSDDE